MSTNLHHFHGTGKTYYSMNEQVTSSHRLTPNTRRSQGSM